MNWVDGFTIANWGIVFQSFLIASLLLILWI